MLSVGAKLVVNRSIVRVSSRECPCLLSVVIASRSSVNDDISSTGGVSNGEPHIPQHLLTMFTGALSLSLSLSLSLTLSLSLSLSFPSRLSLSLSSLSLPIYIYMFLSVCLSLASLFLSLAPPPSLVSLFRHGCFFFISLPFQLFLFSHDLLLFPPFSPHPSAELIIV